MQLTIAEELLLLAYDEKDGRPLIDTSTLDIAICVALLSELWLGERVAPEGDGLRVLTPAPTGDQELDEVLMQLAGKRQPVSSYQLMNISYDWGARRQRLLERLAWLGVLSSEKRTLLKIFSSRRFPEADPRVEQEIRDRVGRVLRGERPEPKTATLIALMHACELTKRMFPEAPADRIKEIMEGDFGGRTLRKWLDDLTAAGITAAVTATTAAVFVSTT